MQNAGTGGIASRIFRSVPEAAGKAASVLPRPALDNNHPRPLLITEGSSPPFEEGLGVVLADDCAGGAGRPQRQTGGSQVQYRGQ